MLTEPSSEEGYKTVITEPMNELLHLEMADIFLQSHVLFAFKLELLQKLFFC